jgi:hypothetical protein
MQAQMPEPKKSFGPAIGIIVIILIVIAGGLYFWSGRSGDTEATPESAAVTQAPPVSKSDDVDSIEKDLQTGDATVDLSGLDAIK